MFTHTCIHDVVVVVVVANDTSACDGDTLLVAAFAIVVANDISIVFYYWCPALFLSCRLH